MDPSEIHPELASTSIANSGLIQAAVKKWWGDSLSGTSTDEQYRGAVTALLLENQSRYFGQLEEEGQIPDDVTEKFGENWREDVYEAIKKAWRETPLVDICSIQPLIGPLGSVAYYRHHSTVDVEGVPEIRLDIAIQEVQAESRKSKIRIHAGAIADGVTDTRTVLSMAFEELLTEATREVLGTLLNSAEGAGYTIEAGGPLDVVNQLRLASSKIHRVTQRGPANNIICDDEMLAALGFKHDTVSNGGVQKVGTLEGKWNVYLDPLFPPGKLMAWYQGHSLLDTGIIYSPYYAEFAPMDSSGIEYAGRVRHKITLVRPEAVYLVQLGTQV